MSHLVVGALELLRPGGGGSFSGGSGGGGGGGYSGGGSSGGGGGGELIFFLIRLCFVYPEVGVPLLVIVIVFFVYTNSRGKPWQTARTRSSEWPSSSVSYAPAPRAPAGSWRRRLEALRSTDPNFSLVLFEDFLYALYAEAQHARGGGRTARLSAYLSPNATAALPAVEQVSDVVVGAMRIDAVEWRGPSIVVSVLFETNYTETAGGRPQSYYVEEMWRLSRATNALSRTPDRARVFPCPSCGAPQEAVIAGTCSHCQKQVATGGFDWLVQAIDVRRREARGPMLTSDVAEQGTELPTIVDPDAASAVAALRQRDPSFDWEAFKGRVALVFAWFQTAWAARDLSGMRPFFSDNLLEQQRYWVEAYLRAHLRNVTENARISNIELARATSDRFYDALTVRVYASSLDYTIDDAGKIVSGSRSRPRSYSEYWTLIRGTNRRGPTHTRPECPNCGAPLKVNMAGFCEYCRAKVTTGDFDWVLSRIEQDEVYE